MSAMHNDDATAAMAIAFLKRPSGCLVGLACLLLVVAISYYCWHGYQTIRSDTYRLSSDPRTSSGNIYCSFELFKSYHQQLGYFPSGGYWEESLSETAIPRFVPDLCRFKSPSIPPRDVKACWENSKARYILIVGDSNAVRYTWSFVYHLRKFFRCSVTRREEMEADGYIPDRNYFSRGNATLKSFMVTQERFCHHCRSEEWTCKPPGNSRSNDVIVEHISTSAVIDTSLRLRVPRSRWQREHGGRYGYNVWAETFQEYLLRYYIKNKPPDIFLMVPPFNHAKNINSIERTKVDLRFLRDLLDVFLPKESKIIWMPSFMEFESKRVNIPYWINATSDGNMLAWEKLDQLNHVLYDVISDQLVGQSGRVIGFLDLIQASSSRESWCLDGVHLKSVWYDVMMSYLMELICGDI